jgi:hypothetical protein
MQGKDFIYFLFDENNNSYYQYGDTVLLSSSLRPLEFTPDGWKKIQIQNQRNGTYFAVDRSFTVPLEYVKDGGQILKYIYYNYGIEAKVYMSICEQQLYFDATHYGYYYKLLYRGEIDLANFKHDGVKVTVNIMEGGIVKFIKAYENTKYEIPVNVIDAIDLYMDGVQLSEKHNFIIPEVGLPFAHLLFASFINKEGNASGVASFTVFGHLGYPDFATSDEYLFAVTQDIAGMRLKGQIKFKCTGSAAHYYLRLITSTGRVLTIIDDEFVTQDQTYTFDFDYLFDAFEGEKFFLVNATQNNPFFIANYLETEFSLLFQSIYRGSIIKALRPLYVFQQLISKISGGTYTAQSDYLANQINDVVVTCGDAIRGIDDAVIKTSLRDFFTSFNSHFGLGMGMLGSTLRLEPKSFWVQYTDVIDLGEVSKMKVSPANDLLINNIKVGTPNQDYDDVNGKQEFNTTSEYSAPITRVAKELNLVSVYRADCYGIEFTRLNLDGKTTTDNDSDNDVFMIHIEDAPQGDGLYHLDRSLNAGAAGLLSPATVFNLYLTPARALRRNGDYIRSLFYKLESRYLTFQTADKNDDVVAGGITENADVQVASLSPALFSCNYLEFETKVPIDTLELLRANPLKAFAGTWAGFSFVGIPDKISVQPGDNGAQTFKLLAAPTQDFTPLISIDG